MLATGAGAVHSWYAKNQYVQAAMLSEGFRLVQPIKNRVSDYFIEHGRLPSEHNELNLPEASDIFGTSVRSVAIQQGGVLHVRFGNEVESQSMVFTPRVSPRSGYVYWRCTSDSITRGVLEKLRPSCNYQPSSSQSHLMGSVASGDIPQLKYWLSQGANLNLMVHGVTPLMLAVANQDLELSKSLLSLGADPNLSAKNYDGYTALIMALKAGDADLVRLLLENGASVLVADHHGQLPEQHAKYADSRAHNELYTFLIQGALNPQFASHPAQSSYRADPRFGQGATLLTQTNSHIVRSPLEVAIVADETQIAKELIDQGASINAYTSTRSRPLIEASKRGNVLLVSYLLSKGADINGTDSMGRSAYLAAVGAGHEQLAAALVVTGADSRVSDVNGVDAVFMGRSRNLSAKSARWRLIATNE